MELAQQLSHITTHKQQDKRQVNVGQVTTHQNFKLQQQTQVFTLIGALTFGILEQQVNTQL